MSMLVGGTTRDTLQRPELRRLVAYAANEMRRSFRIASRKSESWRPSLYSVSSLSPKLFEVALLSPYPFFWLARRVSLLPLSDMPAAGSIDIADGREPTVIWNLQNVLKIGDLYDAPMPLCKALLTNLQQLQRNKGRGAMDSDSLRSLLSLIPQDYSLYTTALPRWARVWVLRLGIAFVVLVVAVIIPLLRIS